MIDFDYIKLKKKNHLYNSCHYESARLITILIIPIILKKRCKKMRKTRMLQSFISITQKILPKHSSKLFLQNILIEHYFRTIWTWSWSYYLELNQVSVTARTLVLHSLGIFYEYFCLWFHHRKQRALLGIECLCSLTLLLSLLLS